jgi:hypothetical protein
MLNDRNGARVDRFLLHRRIQQGDPISHYLFVMCMDLSHLHMQATDQGLWHTLRVGRHRSKVSHLMFADDLLP